MTIEAMKEKLHHYIDEANDEKIINLLTVIEDQSEPVSHWSEDKAFVAELDERVRRYEEGIDPAYSWEEVEASINELREKRAAKK